MSNDWKKQYLVASAFKLTEDKAPQTALRWVDADVLRQRRDYKEQKAEFLGAHAAIVRAHRVKGTGCSVQCRMHYVHFVNITMYDV